MLGHLKLVETTEWQASDSAGEPPLLPDGWVLTTFAEQGGFKSGKDCKAVAGADYPVYGSSSAPMAQRANRPLHAGGTFIIGRKGTIDKPFFIAEPFWCVDTALYFDTECAVSAKFMFYAAKLVDWARYNRGSVLPSLVQSDVENIAVYWPGSPAHRALVVQVLSTQEQVVSGTKKLISGLKTRLHYFSRELLTGRLRVKEIDGKPVLYKNECWKEVEINGENVEIPEDWNHGHLSQWFNVSMGATILSKETAAHASLTSVPVYSATAGDSYFGYLEKASGTKILKEGDLVLGARGSLGFVKRVRGPCTSTQTTIQLKKKDTVNSEFCYNVLKCGQERLFRAEGSGVPQLTVRQASELGLALPGEAEQVAITRVLQALDSELSASHELLALEQQKFKWLLANLMTGKYLVQEVPAAQAVPVAEDKAAHQAL